VQTAVLKARVHETASGSMEAAVIGAGPPIMLVHGTGGSWRQAVLLAQDLADRWTVVLPSRPGYGQTPAASGRGPEEQAAALVALLDALGMGPVGIFGVSGAGPSTIAFAIDYPDRCRAVVLSCAVAAHLASTRGMWVASIPGAVAIYARGEQRKRFKALTNVDTRAKYFHALLTDAERALLADDPILDADLTSFLRGLVEAPSGAAGLRNDLNGVKAAHRNGPLLAEKITAPTLILHGESDNIVPVSHARYHADVIPDTTLQLFPSAAHLLNLTHRRETTAHIRTFFETHAR
jgi:2-hydroxy-6-oxonona-2,4-dienedioate hydrolase